MITLPLSIMTNPLLRSRRLRSLTLGLAALTSFTVNAGNWPNWRGPANDGVAPEKDLPTRWSKNENVRWKTPLPDRGNSTPIVWEGRVFVTQAVENDNLRALLCFDRADGKLLWQSGVTYKEKERSHDANPPCSASPVTDGHRVIAWFGSAGLFCYDFAGKELWRRDLGKQDHTWGYASSPIIFQNLCILNFGPGERTFLVAVDKTTGATVWQRDVPPVQPKERTDGFAGKTNGVIGSWSTPLVVKSGSRSELVVSFPGQVRAFDPLTGKDLWSCDGLNPLIYTSAIYGEGLVVAMGGYSGSTVAVKPGGQGDVTATRRVWQKIKTKTGIGSGVIHNGHIYILNGAIAQCLDLKSGETVWEQRVQGAGADSESWSSVALAGDKLYVVNHSGETVVLRASPTFELIGVNSLENELSNSSVAISNGEIFVRTHKHLWCIGRAAGAHAAAPVTKKAS